MSECEAFAFGQLNPFFDRNHVRFRWSTVCGGMFEFFTEDDRLAGSVRLGAFRRMVMVSALAAIPTGVTL